MTAHRFLTPAIPFLNAVYNQAFNQSSAVRGERPMVLLTISTTCSRPDTGNRSYLPRELPIRDSAPNHRAILEFLAYRER
jgi:hypothetical protein